MAYFGSIFFANMGGGGGQNYFQNFRPGWYDSGLSSRIHANPDNFYAIRGRGAVIGESLRGNTIRGNRPPERFWRTSEREGFRGFQRFLEIFRGF